MLTDRTVYSLPSDHPNYCSPLRPFPIPDATSEAYGCWNRWLNGGNQIPSAVHDINGVLVVAPESWSETAVSIAYTRWAYKAEPIHERSIYDMAFRLAYTWATRGLEHNYFDSQQEASEFLQECFEDILLQRWFPNSPQWFNTGIYDVYGIEGESCGLWKVFPEDPTEAFPVEGRYKYPQVSACFIQGVEDDLTEGNGILPSIVNEARLFKMGSGVGSNWSPIRHKEAPLSNGGHSSGLISFLRIGDTNAGAIKSGGTTRRAAKMVVLDVSHPDIVEFVEWKLREEDKVAQMAWASQQLQGKTTQELTALGFPKALVDRIAMGHVPNPLDLDFNGEAVQTVSGQNSNNSIRIPNSFLKAVDDEGDWPLLSPVDGSTVATVPAKMLWDKICLSAWACADPGVQFSDLIEAANPVKREGTINASNPCSEYLFLDNTSCNLASTNLVKLLDDNGRLDSKLLTQVARRITTVLDISVEIASFPSKAIAEGTYAYRTLGMGFSNLGGLLMALGIPYDSDKGRDVARDIAACMMNHAQAQSGKLGERLGNFRGLSDDAWRVFDSQSTQPDLIETHMRNAQHMVIAPCGTIGLGMDCDALGIEPALGLITYKRLADSDEVLTLVNSLVPRAMESLGFTLDDIHAFSQGLLDHNGDFYKACEHVGIDPSHRNLDKVLATSLGTPNIPWEAHIKMLAAVQPHISGGISKTINMPEESTVEDVSRAYRMAHKLGVKCVALFRNGCKDAPYSVKRATVPDGPGLLGLPENLLSSSDSIRDRVFLKLLAGAWNGWCDDVLRIAIRREHERAGNPLTRAQMLDAFNELITTVVAYRHQHGAEWDPAVLRAMEYHQKREMASLRHINQDWQDLVRLAEGSLTTEATYDDILETVESRAERFNFGELVEYQILNDALSRRSSAATKWLDDFTADESKSLRATYVSNVTYDLSEGRNVRHIEKNLSDNNAADGAPFSCEELDEILAEGIALAKPARQEETSVVGWGRRDPLPLASAVKVKATVAGQHTMHVTIPTFDDGAPSEVFVETGDTGSATNALMDTVARLSSKCLQMGLPVDELVDLLQSVRFEPSGIVNGPEQFKNINGGPLFVNSPLGVVAKALKLVEARRQLHDTIHDIVEERLKSTSYPAHDVIYVSPEVHEGLRDDVKHADSHPVAPLTARLNNERCPSCKSPNIIPSGVCKVCADCGESVGGCS